MLVPLAIVAFLSWGDSAQLVGLLMVVAGFVAVGRVKAKDSTIATWRGEAEAQEARADRLVIELEGTQERADREHEQRRDCEKKIATLEGELKVLERYTAQEALTSVGKELVETRRAIVAAINANGELVLKNIETIAKLDESVRSTTTPEQKMRSAREHLPPDPSGV